MGQSSEVIQELKKRQGTKTLRAYAQTIGCSASYLSDVYLEKREPGPKILEAIGLERVVTYKKRRWR